MFKSSLANEMSAFLELRCMSVCEQTVIADKCALNTLDQYMIDCGFHGTVTARSSRSMDFNAFREKQDSKGKSRNYQKLYKDLVE